MEREIKFRAFVKGHKLFNYGDLVRNMSFDPFGTVVECAICHGNDYNIVEPSTVGQYTGLKDKNGKEIYEGDILRTETDKPMVVSWNEKFASFCLWREGWAFNHFFGEACDPERCEVIGNIHENPELLTQPQN